MSKIIQITEARNVTALYTSNGITSGRDVVLFALDDKGNVIPQVLYNGHLVPPAYVAEQTESEFNGLYYKTGSEIKWEAHAKS